VCVCVCVRARARVCNSELQSIATSRVLKWPINPISNPSPVYSHTPARDDIFEAHLNAILTDGASHKTWSYTLKLSPILKL
jgi:hypothetical protein